MEGEGLIKNEYLSKKSTRSVLSPFQSHRMKGNETENRIDYKCQARKIDESTCPITVT